MRPPPPSPIHTPPKAPVPVKQKSKIPLWAVAGAGGTALFLLLAAALFAMQKTPGFTVTIKGVAPSAEVYVGEIRRGIPHFGKANDVRSPVYVLRLNAHLHPPSNFLARVRAAFRSHGHLLPAAARTGESVFAE